MESRELPDDPAERGMKHFEQEAELSPALFLMRDGECAGRETVRQGKTHGADAEEIVRTAEHERAVLLMHGQRHANAAAHIFFEAGCAGETFGGVNDLREAVLAC